jgi:hypothetical protein
MTARRVVDLIGAGVSREIPVPLPDAPIGVRSRWRRGRSYADGPAHPGEATDVGGLPVALAVEYGSASRCGRRVEVVAG